MRQRYSWIDVASIQVSQIYCSNFVMHERVDGSESLVQIECNPGPHATLSTVRGC
jgi:hypothetical protein